jgi:protein-disulfide isomerase
MHWRDPERVAVPDASIGDPGRNVDFWSCRTRSCLAATLLAACVVVVGQTAGSAAPTVRAERHSPREGYPSLGPPGAKNTLVFFTDYQCPVCPRAARELDRLVADFNGDLRVELHHNPLAMHKNAYDAAVAAKAAQRQGKFWEYHEALLASRSLTPETLAGLAVNLGLDAEKFKRDFDDPEVRRQVTAEAQEALDASALGTPGFLINGHVEVGWASLPWLEQVIRAHAR